MTILHFMVGICGLMGLGLATPSNAKQAITPPQIWTTAQTAHTITDTKTGQVIAYQDFLTKLATADYLILGEYHDSTPQHHLASQLLKDLHAKRPQGSFLMEMLSIDQQPAIDTAQKTKPPFKKLPKAIGWQSSWDWALYGKLVAQPFEFGYPLIATNLTKNEVKTLMQGAKPLKGYASTTDDIKAVIKERILKAHGFDKDTLDKADENIVDNMVAIQQFRDRRMAEKILSSPKPTLLLTGNYHAQKSVGIPMHLSDLHDGKPPINGIVVLMSKQADEFIDTDADFIWLIKE